MTSEVSKDENGLPSPRWLQFRTSNRSLQRAPKSEATLGRGGQGLSVSPRAWCCGSLAIPGYASIPLLGAQSKNLEGASDSPTSHRSANPVRSTFEILMLPESHLSLPPLSPPGPATMPPTPGQSESSLQWTGSFYLYPP